MGSDFNSDPAYEYEQRLLLKGIAAAVENLPARECNLILRYLGLEGTALNFRELAMLLNYNGPSSAEKAYRRAVEKLKAALWEGEYGQYRRAKRLVNREMARYGEKISLFAIFLSRSLLQENACFHTFRVNSQNLC